MLDNKIIELLSRYYYEMFLSLGVYTGKRLSEWSLWKENNNYKRVLYCFFDTNQFNIIDANASEYTYNNEYLHGQFKIYLRRIYENILIIMHLSRVKEEK